MLDTLPHTASVVHTGVDWISLSCNRPAGVAELLRWRDAAFERLADGGYDEKRFTNHGYEGRSRGAVAVSIGRRACLVQLSGNEAYTGWRDIAKHATNISRIDLACTVRPVVRTDALARESYSPDPRATRGRGRPIELTLIQSQDRGDTLYVGSRKSDQLGRLYDKDKESKEPQWSGCWRYEVQYRRGFAVEAARQLAGKPTDAASCTETVSSWFNARGVPCSFAASSGSELSAPSARLSDDESWLRWVRRCVQPRARELTKRYGWRYVAESCVGRISSFEEWETLMRDIEFELEVIDDGGGD